TNDPPRTRQMTRFPTPWRLLATAAAAAAVGCCGVPSVGGGLVGPSVPVLPQIVPPAPTPPPPGALGIAPGAPPPGPPTVWSKLGLSAEQREFRRRAMCDTPAGKLMGFAMAPASKLSLGLIPPFCPGTPTLQQLLDKGAIGAASKVKMDKLNAKKRKQAVEALKDVDCHYWPEAEEALIAALRTDRNEAVRYTAAKTLRDGKCCTVKTLEALSISADGSDRDGAPCEVSEAVRAMAAKALKKCLECESCLNRCGQKRDCVPTGEGVPEERPRDEEPTRAAAVIPAVVKPAPPTDPATDPDPGVRLVAYYDRVRRRPADSVITAARQVLTRVAFPVGADMVPAGHPDYEAVDLFPELPTAGSPRPVGLFEPPPAGPRQAAPLVRPRDPSRPANILDALAGGPPPAGPGVTRTPAAPPAAVPTAETPEPPMAAPARPVAPPARPRDPSRLANFLDMLSGAPPKTEPGVNRASAALPTTVPPAKNPVPTVVAPARPAAPPARLRDPSRPSNILDMLSGSPSQAGPGVTRTPVAPPAVVLPAEPREQPVVAPPPRPVGERARSEGVVDREPADAGPVK
ncbi:MAG TPA: HEAT repeat domain-containing protein, partial [Urbifossiella sp.]|nr:HEAT repeat domain-containing protein [Urbifossiella sp.]